ncbi:hypothetical protein GGQ20_003178, partial [Salinibacter ruber]|nr:hypothetical protein [Salinibacter ruber]
MLPEQTVLVVTAQTVATVSSLQENYASRPKSYYQAGLLYMTVLVLSESRVRARVGCFQPSLSCSGPFPSSLFPNHA